MEPNEIHGFQAALGTGIHRAMPKETVNTATHHGDRTQIGEL
jgi:hypothetical protein